MPFGLGPELYDASDEVRHAQIEEASEMKAALQAIVNDAWLCADGNYLVDAKFIEAAEELL